MLGEKAFFTTINQVVMRNLQTYGMTVDFFNQSVMDVCVWFMMNLSCKRLHTPIPTS